jgi:3D (Asp-Asp-Asp) domain-containing protein
MTSAGACRVRTLITNVQKSFAAGAPKEPVRHKSGRLARVSAGRNRLTVANVLHLGQEPAGSCLATDRTNLLKTSRFLCYGPALLGARLAGLGVALVLLGVSVAAAAGPGGSLRQQVNTLEARTHRAILDLYALDTRLHAAQTRLTALRAQADRLRAEQALLAQQLSAAQRTLAVSRHELGRNLSLLYKQGDVSALAVMLGSTSLDDALSRLDALNGVADESRRVVEVTTSAQTRLMRLRNTLAARRAALDAAVADAERTAGALVSARNERLSFISSLHTQQKLKTGQIAALQTVAQRVERKSNTLQAEATPDAATTQPADPVPVVETNGRTLTVSSTGYSLSGHTATGMPVGWGVAAVDPGVIPLGTRLTIPGYGEAVAADTGSAVRGNTIDLWFPTLAQARAWGRRTVTITLH